MKKINSIQFFIGMSIVGALLIVLYACITGNQNQTFTDVVIEYTSRCDANKSAERNMFYIFPIIGSLIYLVAWYVNKWNRPNLFDREISSNGILLTVLVVSVVANYVIYQRFHIVVVAALAIAVVALLKREKLAVQAVVMYFLLVYGIIGIYRALVVIGVAFDTSSTVVSLIAAVISFVALILIDNSKYIFRCQLIAQLSIPLTLLLYLLSTYETSDGQTTNIAVPKRIQIVIGLLIIVFIIEAVVRLVKGWKNVSSFQEVLTYGTIVSIMAFNRFSGTGSIADFDLHHNYENVIGFSQVFELGQNLFSEYIPVSGMYSMLHGFVFWFFGHGLGSFYYVCTNLYFLFVILVIAFLLRKQLKAEWVLLVSLLFLVKDYNRVALIAPIVLLLAWPALIEKKNLWLKAWFLTSFVHGLYYPIFGAAVALGFMPLAVWQIISYAKSGNLKKDVKKTGFWIWWALCLVPPIAGIKLLFGTAKHILAMGSQTIYADGIARFGQIIPINFFPYIQNLPLRIILYYLASYWIVICILWLAVAVALKVGNIDFSNKTITVNNPSALCIALSMAIILLVSFSFTVVRFDIGDIYSRTDGAIKVASILLLIILARYMDKNEKSYRLVLIFTILITSMVSAEAVLKIDNNSKLNAYYSVPENDIYVEDVDVRIGKAFIDVDSYSYISNINGYIKNMDTENSYLGVVDSFGLYYFCNIKGGSVMEIFNTIKGYGATEETVELLRKKHSIVGRNINPDANYYLYHWLMTSGEYIWNNDLRVFEQNDGSYSYDDVIEAHKYLELNYPNATPLGYTCSAWGRSIDALEPIFTNFDVHATVDENVYGTQVNFDKSFDGKEADFLYIEFDDMDQNEFYYLHDGDGSAIDVSKYGILKNIFKKNYNQGMTVTISWNDEMSEIHSVHCLMDQGKLLIPVGSGAGWYFNQHDNLSVKVTVNDEEIDTPAIKTVRMLKLREVK